MESVVTVDHYIVFIKVIPYLQSDLNFRYISNPLTEYFKLKQLNPN